MTKRVKEYGCSDVFNKKNPFSFEKGWKYIFYLPNRLDGTAAWLSCIIPFAWTPYRHSKHPLHRGPLHKKRCFYPQNVDFQKLEYNLFQHY